MSELLPCPWCGGKAEIEFIDYCGDHEINEYSVICSERDESICDVQPHTSGWSKPELAIKAWNTRQSQWVPVDDRLPKIREIVLLYFPTGSFRRGSLWEDGLYYAPNSFGGDTWKIKPSHWMPLPEPPK